MAGPLTGVRIVEFAGLGPGPFCGMMLADHGAEVIRLGRVGAEPGIDGEPSRQFLNRSRKALSVNIKTAEGRELSRRLCKRSDGLIEGFRPGVMERLGLGPEVLLKDNPKLVYGRMTGWGQDGPYAKMAGHDINYIALSGALHACGRAGEKPTPPMNLVGDFGGGGMMLAFGMLAAIMHARSTGVGQVIDCAMTEGSAVLMAMIYSMHAEGIWSDRRGVNLVDSGAHFYDSYETSDGKFISIGSIESQFYRRLLEGIGFADDPEFTEQLNADAWPQLKERLSRQFRTKTRDEWCRILEKSDCCFAPVLSLEEAADHEHNVARDAFVDVCGVRQPAPAPRYSHSQASRPSPMVSGHEVTEQILDGLGYSPSEVDWLRSNGTID
jgi:alpha-methylacyl-CoA racemase